MNKRVLAVGIVLLLGATPGMAEQFGDRAVINQRIGGGRPIDEPSSVDIMKKSGGDWNVDLSCGDMSLNAELMGSFNAGAFKELQASLMGQLMAALNPLSLLGAALQRANPDLYDQLMNGNALATDAFNTNLANCQGMQQEILNRTPDGAMKKLAIGEDYANAVKKHASGGYQLKDLILSDKGGKSYDSGSNGVTFGGEKRGTVDKPINVTEYTTRTGFNALAGRSSTSTATLSSSAAKKLGFSNSFKSPAEADEFISEVVGETELYTDSSATPRVEQQGIGAKAAFARELENVSTNLNALSNKSVSSLTDTELANASTSSITVNRDLILALKQIHPAERQNYINALATDIALSRTYDRLLHSVRIIDAGMHDDSVANVEAVREEAAQKRERLVQEMDLLEREMRFKRDMAGGASIDIMHRANLENTKATMRSPGGELPVNSAN